MDKGHYHNHHHHHHHHYHNHFAAEKLLQAVVPVEMNFVLEVSQTYNKTSWELQLATRSEPNRYVRVVLLLKIGRAIAVAHWIITGGVQCEFLVVAAGLRIRGNVVGVGGVTRCHFEECAY
jgi:hypothetical protein